MGTIVGQKWFPIVVLGEQDRRNPSGSRWHSRSANSSAKGHHPKNSVVMAERAIECLLLSIQVFKA
jgi:hypothetical protein